MIEEKDSYECTKCRLSFESLIQFQSHINSKHVVKLKNKQYVKEPDNSEEEIVSHNNKFFNQISRIENEMMNGFKFMEEDLKSSSEETKHNVTEKNTKNFISEDNLDIGTVYSCHDEVEEVFRLVKKINLKNKSLNNFNDNTVKPFFDKLINVMIIDISKNVLSRIDDIAKIKSVRSLNISSNKISDIMFIDNLKNLDSTLSIF